MRHTHETSPEIPFSRALGHLLHAGWLIHSGHWTCSFSLAGYKSWRKARLVGSGQWLEPATGVYVEKGRVPSLGQLHNSIQNRDWSSIWEWNNPIASVMERGLNACDQIKKNVYLNAGLGATDKNLIPQCFSSFGWEMVAHPNTGTNRPPYCSLGTDNSYKWTRQHSLAWCCYSLSCLSYVIYHSCVLSCNLHFDETLRLVISTW